LKNLISILFLCTAFYQNSLAIEKRSRSEGIPGISSSNTLGAGNIWFGMGVKMFMQTTNVKFQDLRDVPDELFLADVSSSIDDSSALTSKDFIIAPQINGTIGLTSFMQIEINSIPYDGQKIGLTMASLKLTAPGNDNLRFWGFGGKVNVALSTEENKFTALEETPGFDPLLTFTGILDVDFIKKYPDLPLKLYLNYSNYDNFRFFFIPINSIM